jgi:hypothetical protein
VTLHDPDTCGQCQGLRWAVICGLVGCAGGGDPCELCLNVHGRNFLTGLAASGTVSEPQETAMDEEQAVEDRADEPKEVLGGHALLLVDAWRNPDGSISGITRDGWAPDWGKDRER